MRGPSSFCSCVGYRPSLGAVSRFGMSELTANLDSIGIITNTVYQSCYLAYLGMGFDVKDMMSSQEVNNLRESMLQVL
ncbi:amidase family protein, partial [Acinetobacter baumannii]